MNMYLGLIFETDIICCVVGQGVASAKLEFGYLNSYSTYMCEKGVL